ncbi:right-handed parallel beta-helix repeat-containing protein [Cellulomonas palmilytica]|uniref:right-handed parallel beta-helix repeat-containing protein n=1 Tax=Cellulomonas palmilytica TaxID=2608402 RepID=UPI001F3F406E|nr:right-handed parallel beta-helix repeat-containing protein [Cellulomonas palmilytica]UJP39313.1 right-handed parallel beta-helix repeat-containing protein [Cellulomonas palmilytica]
MALPAGISTCTVTKSPPKDILGNLGTLVSATVKADRDLVWAETGETLYGQQAIPVAPIGDGLSFPLIHVNQAGVLDANTGEAVTNWFYTITLTVKFGARQQVDEYRLQVVLGQLTVDLDDLPRKGTVLPSVSAPLPAVTSVAGKTANVSADDLASELAGPLRLPLVIDVRDFIEPGETLDLTGEEDAHVILQRAVDALGTAAASDGQPRVLTLPRGRFRLEVGLTWRSRVGLRGAGRLDTALAPVGRVCAVNGWAAPGDWDGEEYLDCSFSDFTIDCSGQDHTAYDYAMKGVFIQHMRRLRFERVTIRDSWATAFGCDFLSDATFVDCEAVNAGRGTPASRWGTGAGFGVGMGYEPVEPVTVINCVARDCYTHGFFIEHLDRPEAQHYSRGFRLIGATATGCYTGFFDAGGRGAVVQSGSFTGNTYGAALRGTGAASQAGVEGLIVDSVLAKNATAGVALLDTSAGSYTLRGNDISDNTGAGVTAPSGSKVGPGLRLAQNRVCRNGGGGVKVEVTTVRAELSSNIVHDNTGDGVLLSASSASLRIVDNDVRGNTGRGVYLSGATMYATDPTIQRNTAVGNGDDGLAVVQVVSGGDLISDNVTDDGSTLTNLLADPSFESNSTGTTSLNATLSRPTGASPHSGSYLLRGTYSGAGGTGYGVISATGTVAPGQHRKGSLWVRAVAGRRIYPTLNYGPGGGQEIGAKVIATGDWQQLFIEGVIPDSRTTCRVAVYVDTDAAISPGEILDVDDVSIV